MHFYQDFHKIKKLHFKKIVILNMKLLKGETKFFKQLIIYSKEKPSQFQFLEENNEDKCQSFYIIVYLYSH